MTMLRERPFVPTTAQRELVELMSATGHPLHEICSVVENPTTGMPISGPMLKDVFRRELERGPAKYITAVERDMFRMALSEEHTPVKLRAALAVLRAKGGWQEGHVIDHRVPAGLIEGAHDILQSKFDRFAERARETGISGKSNGNGSE